MKHAVFAFAATAVVAFVGVAIGQPPSSLDACLNQAKTVSADDQLAACSAIIAAPTDPRQSPIAYMARGQLRHLRGDHAGAIPDLTAAIDANHPAFAEAYYMRGLSRYASGIDRNQVIDDFAASVAFNTRQASKAHLYSGAAWMELGAANYEIAISEFETALALEPALSQQSAILKPYAIALARRGNVRLEAGDASGAVLDYDRALAIDPKVATADANRRIAFGRAGQPADKTAVAARETQDAATATCTTGLKAVDVQTASAKPADKVQRLETLLFSLQQRIDIATRSCKSAPLYAARLTAWQFSLARLQADCKAASPVACKARLPEAAAPQASGDTGIVINIPTP